MKKKILTVMLAVCITGLYTFGDMAAVFAEDATSTDNGTQVETTVDSTSSSTGDQSGDQVSDSSQTDQSTTSESTDTTTTDQTSKDETTTTDDKSSDTTKDSTEVSYPAQDFSDSVDGTSIKVTAPEGAFPEGTTMKVKAVADSEVKDAVSEAAGSEVSQLQAIDISFYKDGKEIEPKKDVTVDFSNIDLGENDGVEVYHISDSDSTATKVAGSESSDSVSVKTDEFSTYVIVGSGNQSSEPNSSESDSVKVGASITLYDSNATNGTWSIKSGSKNITLSGEGTYWYYAYAKITGKQEGSAVVYYTYTKWSMSERKNVSYIDEFDITVTKTNNVTIQYDKNGGSTAAPASVSAKSGATITLPTYSGTKNGYTFVGWSTDSDANGEGSGHYTKAVYKAGTNYTVPDTSTTLYAIWASNSTTDAQFFVRLDGTIPTEPQGHASSEYTGAINISGAIKAGCAYFYTNSTIGVASQLTTTPTDEQIKAVYPSYDSSTQYVMWYVVKHESTWHIDGVLLQKSLVNLSYDANAPAGTWSNMPDGQQYAVGATATVSSKIPTRKGYTFTGWNTKADGTGTSYNPNATFTINESTTLYAQWVSNVAITIKANSSSKTYDGTALEDSGYTYTGTLNDGDTIYTVRVSGSQKNVGTSKNKASGAVIKDSNGNDVTNNYVINYVDGDLTVSKQSITITANSDSKTYDGTALTNDGYSKTGDLATGDVLSVTITGSQLNAGNSNNVASGAVIKHDGTDVTSNYEITYADGTLTVEKQAVEITANSTSKTYDGTALTDNGYTITSGAFAAGEGLASVTVSGSQLFVGHSDNTITGHTLTAGTDADNYTITYKPGTLTVNRANIAITVTANNASKTYDGTTLTNDGFSHTGDLATGDTISTTVKGSQTNAGNSANVASDAKVMHGTTDVTENYVITYINGTLTVNPVAIELTANSASKSYDGTALTAKGYKITNGAFIGTDGFATVTVEGSQTKAGSSANTITGYTLKEGTNKDNYTITKVDGTLNVTKGDIPITITANSKEKAYDGTELKDSGYTMTAGKLASGDTISSVTVNGSQKDAGSTANIATAAVIMHGNEDVTDNYKITYVNGSLTVSPAAIELTADSATGAYNGEALTANGYKITKGAFVGTDGLANVTVSGSQTTVGDSANTITGYTLKSGTDGNNYTITCMPGILRVTQASIPITIKANDATKTYDGSTLSDSGYSQAAGNLATGDELVGTTVTGSQTDAGSSANIASAAVIKHGSTDVTANYKITYAKGTLTVNPVAIELTAKSGSKAYDGTALTNSGYDITSGAFVGTDGLASVTVEGSQTLVGSSANTITGHTLKDGTKAENYTITCKPGTLTVTKASIALTITANSGSKTYDGNTLTNDGFTLTNGALATGDTLTATVTGTQTEAGSSANAASAAKIMHGTTDVTSNYAITYADGTLTVNPVAIELTAKSDSKAYDGTALTNSGYDITSGAFVGTDGLASVTVDGSQTLVGNSANTITGHTLKDGTKAANYTITYKPGTLTVTQASIALTIKADSDSKTYDGSALTKNSYTSEGTLATGDTISSVTLTGTQTDAGSSANKASAAVIKHGDADVTENYSITYTDGTLTVNPVAIELTANSDTKVFDNTALTNSGYKITKGAFVGTDGLAEVAVEGSQTLVGSSANTIKGYSLKDGTKAENYNITTVEGTLTVTAAPVPPSPETTTYTVVANYFTSTDNGSTYTQDNAAAVQVQGATSVNVGAIYTVNPDTTWTSYNSNAYVADASKSTLSGTAVADSSKNVLVVNYYRITGNNNNGGGDNNNSNGGNTNNNSDNNNSNGGTTTNTASNNNASGPDTGDNTNLVLWSSIGVIGTLLAGIMFGLRRREEEND